MTELAACPTEVGWFSGNCRFIRALRMFRGIQSIHGQLFYPKSLVLKKYSSSECGYVVIRNHQSRTRFRMPQIRCSLDGAASLSLTRVFERKGGGVSKALCAGGVSTICVRIMGKAPMRWLRKVRNQYRSFPTVNSGQCYQQDTALQTFRFSTS